MSNVYSLKSYFYELPENLIAQYPLKNRDQSRLMIINRQHKTITHDTFSNLAEYLPSKTCFVVNNSKVIPARLRGVKRNTGGEVEVFLLKPLSDGYSYEALLKPLKRIPEGHILDFGKDLSAILENKEKRIVRFNKKNIIKLLEKNGHIPLPPYIKREDESSDKKNYQTVYAKKSGSVAAPTAGLHFTNSLIHHLKAKSHKFLELTLHVGYGTFKPVETPDIRSHCMHEEAYEISDKAFKQILKFKKNSFPVCAIGTTSCRVLESFSNGAGRKGVTNLFAYPGFSFKMTDHLVTNFHLPYSSLLILVCAFGGYELIMKAYQEAIKKEYRFYSYGDAMLII
jgi:S-adenosylmethionine:tRNA ribosyltransferase-isomerase